MTLHLTRHLLLTASASLTLTLGAAAVWADDFTISTAVTTQNGGNTLNGNDTSRSPAQGL